MKKRNPYDASLLYIRVTGYILGALAGIAFLLCLCFGFGQGVYKEELQTRGVRLMVGSVVLFALFLSIWLARRGKIDRFLLDVYGEECCKPVRNPVIAGADAPKNAEAPPQDGETPAQDAEAAPQGGETT